ncbi:AMIN-like domain-containing (lipo)protein [Streptomyces sp. NPDC054784]
MRDLKTYAAALLACAGLLAAAPGAGAAARTTAPTTATTAATAAASCAAAWGSLPKAGGDDGSRPLTNVRTGRHDCYDRMVLDIRGDLPATAAGYRVRYVDRFLQDGSGREITFAGGAVLEIVATAPSYDPDTYEPTYGGRGGKPLPGVDLAGYRTFRDARFGASYEGTTQLGLGVRARLPFRVFTTGDRLVVDVAHTWATAAR